MKRTNISLTESQHQALKEDSFKSGESISKILRDLIEEKFKTLETTMEILKNPPKTVKLEKDASWVEPRNKVDFTGMTEVKTNVYTPETRVITETIPGRKLELGEIGEGKFKYGIKVTKTCKVCGAGLKPDGDYCNGKVSHRQ